MSWSHNSRILNLRFSRNFSCLFGTVKLKSTIRSYFLLVYVTLISIENFYLVLEKQSKRNFAKKFADSYLSSFRIRENMWWTHYRSRWRQNGFFGNLDRMPQGGRINSTFQNKTIAVKVKSNDVAPHSLVFFLFNLCSNSMYTMYGGNT